MTALQSVKIYDVLQRHFNTVAESRIVVQEIEQIVENKLAALLNLLFNSIVNKA